MGWKDFLLHLLTISSGLLIAVGIEGCVELHPEHKLVREARETMREEIQYNSNEMKGPVVKVRGLSIVPPGGGIGGSTEGSFRARSGVRSLKLGGVCRFF